MKEGDSAMDTQLYPGIPFSPPAALADNVGAGDTIIPVSDVEAFPPPPNLATIGADEEGETVFYAAKTATALSGCVRGVEGTAKAWPKGEPIARNWTAKDHADLIAAVKEAAQAVASHQGDPEAHSALFAALEARHGRHVVATRLRDPSKPDYGLDTGGEAAAVLDVGPYTGAAQVAAIVSGVEYDAKNMSANGENTPDGTLILRKMEE